MNEQKLEEKKAPGGISRGQWMLSIGGFVLGLLAVFLAARLLLPHRFAGTVMQSNQLAPDFTLVQADGSPLSLASLRGTPVLLFFGYTACPDVCPTTLFELQKMMKALGPKADAIRFLYVTVDPERDTPEKLQTHLARYDPRFTGLSGTLDEITTVASQYGVYFAKRPYGDQGLYTVDHTATLMLINAEGYLKVLYPYGTPGEDIARDLKYLLR